VIFYASVPGEFLGDESVRGTVVSNITHRVRDVRKNSVYVMPLKQKEPEEFLRNNLERMVAKGAALIISHTPPRI